MNAEGWHRVSDRNVVAFYAAELEILVAEGKAAAVRAGLPPGVITRLRKRGLLELKHIRFPGKAQCSTPKYRWKVKEIAVEA